MTKFNVTRAKKRPDYHFNCEGLQPYIEELRAGRFSSFSKEQAENGIAEWGVAVLEIGWLDLEVNISAACTGDGHYENTPVVDYFCCVKGLKSDQTEDWTEAGYLDDFGYIPEVNWKAENWRSLLEQDMVRKLAEFSLQYGLFFDYPNWKGDEDAWSTYDRLHGITRAS